MKKSQVSFLFIALMLLIFGGCSSKEESYVVLIGNTKVYMPEFNVYLYETQKTFEDVGGEDIWETDFDGRSAEEVAKESALNSISYVKVSMQMANEMKITLTDKEKRKAVEDAKVSYQGYTEQEINMLEINQEILTGISQEKELIIKLFQAVTKNFELSEKDFESYYAEYIKDNPELFAEIQKSEEEFKKKVRQEYIDAKKSEIFYEEYNKTLETIKIQKNKTIWEKINLF